MNNLNRMYKRAELSDRVRFTKTNGRQAEGIVVSRQGRGVPGSTFKVKWRRNLEKRSENKVVTVLYGKRSTRKHRRSSRRSSKSRKNKNS